MSNIKKAQYLLLSLIMLTPWMVNAQTCQFVGNRTIQRVWLETGVGLVIVPTENFNNAAGCTNATQAIIPVDHPMYKSMEAAAMIAMTTGTKINAYGCGCKAGWSYTFPVILNFGVGALP